MRFKGMDRNGDGRITRAEWHGNAQSFTEHDWNAMAFFRGRKFGKAPRRKGRRRKRT